MNIFTILLTQPLANGLMLFYKILGENMGLAIIGFSLFLVILLRPLTKKSMQYMKAMKTYAKDIERLKARHKGDPKKFAAAQSEFFKQKGINPTAGCIPQLVQIVIFFALFGVFGSVLGKGDSAAFNNLLYTPLKLAQNQTIHTQFLYLDITKPDVVKLAFLPFALPGPLVVLAALSQMISAKIAAPYVEAGAKLSKKTPQKSDDFASAMQGSMVYTFPFMTLILGLTFPAGMALYWLVFSLQNALQQYQIGGLGGLKPWLRKVNLVK